MRVRKRFNISGVWLLLAVLLFAGCPAMRKMESKRASDSNSVAPMLAKVKAVKKSPIGGKKKVRASPQMWKRTPEGTILSKVSVGGKKYLTLKKLRVTVKVDGIRVRTVMDHIYHNPHKRQLQGTFKYTLPADASISYYAMFVGRQQRTPRFFGPKGAPSRRALTRMAPQEVVRRQPAKGWTNLREARLVPAEKGREVFEHITRQRVDPALLEQEAPNTFSGRVFPIPANGYNRIIIAYEQTLPRFGSYRPYRFRFPPEVADNIDFVLEYNPTLSSLAKHNLRNIRCRQKKKAAFFQCMWEKNMPDRDAIFYFTPKQKVSYLAGTEPPTTPKGQASRFLFAQLPIKLPTNAVKTSARAIFMLDTSMSSDPQRFAASVQLMKEILEKNKISSFNVLLFDVGASWMSPKGWMKNTKQSRAACFARIDKILLEGATDLGRALTMVASPSWLKEKSLGAVNVFFLSDGQLNWGQREQGRALSAFWQRQRWSSLKFFAYRLGLGSENVELYNQMVRRGGATFSCLGASEIKRCATAHTKQSMTLDSLRVDGIDAYDTLIAGRQSNLYPGGLLTFASQYKRDGIAKIELKGRYMGKVMTLSYSITVKAHGDLAPRAWAELAVRQLLELEDPSYTNLIVAFSQRYRIANKHCSFLILETDREYKQYGLEQETKKSGLSSVSAFLQKAWKQMGAPITSRQLWMSMLQKVLMRFKMTQKTSGKAVLSLLQEIPDAQLELSGHRTHGLVEKENVPKSYQKVYQKSRDDFSPFVKESKRRLKRVNVAAAMRSLSCIVELHPTNPKALRLVGYYLMDWQRFEEAAQVFLRVLERRSFEPHAYRDLARALIKMNRFGLAAALYEIVLAGKWDRRFHSIGTVAREEYAFLMRGAMSDGKLKASVRSLLSQRKTLLGLHVTRSKLRVTLTWNTDNTDIDLWVEEPFGEKCWYKNKKTRNGGHLLQDVTQGYGPERYENKGGRGGQYTVRLKFYGHRSTVLGNETNANVTMIMNAGTKDEKIVEKNLVLKKRKEVVKVMTLSL